MMNFVLTPCKMIANGMIQFMAMEKVKAELEANITHRYNRALLRKYDEIFVMDSGKIVERGTFDALMEKGGVFFDLYKVLSK